MTDKELHKLGRREMLQLMLTQGREAEKAKQKLAETQEKMSQLEESYERLKRRLDDKDAQIHKLRAALQSMQGNIETQVTAAAMPAPDDYYAPPQTAVMPATPVSQALPESMPIQPVPPVQQPVRAAQQQPHRTESAYVHTAKTDVPSVPRHSRKEQDYYDYLFGPVSNQGHSGQQLQKERPKHQPQPVRNSRPAPAEPRVQQYQQWAPPQYAREQQPPQGYYDAQQQYRQPLYQYDREPKQPAAHPVPEPHFPQQVSDEFIPVPESEPEKMQMLNVVEIVNGLPVSQNQMLRRSR